VVLRIPCIFVTQKTTERSVEHFGWFPYELLDESLRARLARLFLPGPHAPDRAARIRALKDEVLGNSEIRRDATGKIVLHFESDQLVLLDDVSGREWEWSALQTRVQDDQVQLDAFLNTPLRGLPESSQLFKSELIHPAAYEACQGRNCAAHQLATALGLDYTRLWDEMREFFEAHEYPGEFDYVTVEMVCDWAEKHGHSCYFSRTARCCTNTSSTATRKPSLSQRTRTTCASIPAPRSARICR
jgi:hypothetical protein